jgi:ParB/RepB/Spo0J family partition protein
MNATSPVGTELDLHRLDAPYAHTRLACPQEVRRLMASIDADGQRVPLMVVSAGERWILLDGYRRLAALERLGRDTARVEVWGGPVADALAQVLARHQGRAFEPIEQAWLLSAAMTEGLSQRALATALGKDPSWVSRRLALLAALGEPLQEAIRQGVLSAWAASRVLVPLARANPADAEALLAALGSEPLSTRELAAWYARYSQANRTVRERLVAHPGLFAETLRNAEAPAAADPEGCWLAELDGLRRGLQRLARTLVSLLDPPPPPATRAALRAAVAKTAQTLERLRQPLQQEGEHVVRAATPDDPRAASQGAEPAGDRPHPRAHPSHGAPGARAGAGAARERTPTNRALARTHLDAARALLGEPGQRGADAGAAARAP